MSTQAAIFLRENHITKFIAARSRHRQKMFKWILRKLNCLKVWHL